jgi:arginase
MPEFICYGVPYFVGERQEETSAVSAMKESGFAESIGASWVDVVPGSDRDVAPVIMINRALARAIAAGGAHIPIVFAGDCTSCVGAMKALAPQRPAVVWYDAHGDFNTPKTTLSGFLGGMPLSMLVGRGDMWLMNGVGLDPISETDVILTDGRDLDPGEAGLLYESAVTHLARVEDVPASLWPARRLYVHLDIDVVDSAELPGLMYPVSPGPSVAEVAASLQRVAATGRVAGLLVTLWKWQATADKNRPLQATTALLKGFMRGMTG